MADGTDDSTQVAEIQVVGKRPAQTGGVKLFSPQFRVTLKKNIGRATLGGDVAASDRFSGQRREVDLTSYLGTNGGVSVERSTRAGPGKFAITLCDRLAPDLSDSLYGLVEPLDVIEIRAARDVSTSGSSADQLPIIMRGFVGSVARPEIMTERGPSRQVVIDGQDYGRILQLMNIVYFQFYPLGQDLLTELKFATNYEGGVDGVEVRDVADFVSGIMSNVILKFIDGMREAATAGSQDATSPVVDLRLDVESARGTGAVAPFGLQQWPGGDVWELFRYFGDVGPFNEMYVRDDADGPTLVFRPNPFKNLDGSLIQASSQEPPIIDVFDEEIISLEVARSDADVANYFWCDAPRLNLPDGLLFKEQSAAGADPGGADWALTDYPNADPKLYGVRLMEVQSQQGLRLDGASESSLQTNGQDQLDFFKAKRAILIESNRDNVVLEKGVAELRGNEALQHGSYVRFRRGPNGAGLTWTAYAHTIRHEFALGAPFRTKVTFDRGTGFVERAQHGTGTDAPYFSETSLRGAYGR